MSVLQAMEAVQTIVGTHKAPTAATAEILLTWIQMESTAPADQDSARMMLCWFVLRELANLSHKVLRARGR